MESETVRPIMRCALLVAALASTACTTKRFVTLDQLKVLGPDLAWVTGSDQSVVLMYEPKVVRDTLTGYVGRHREKVPAARVNKVRVQTAAPARTALLVAGITVGVTGFLVLVGGSGQSAVIVSTTGPPGDCDQAPEQAICTGVPD
jgi:hypothetical protein